MEILGLEIGPEPVHHIEIRIDRLHRQESGQPAHAAPADHKIHPGHIMGMQFPVNLLPVASGTVQTGKIPFPAVVHQKIHPDAAAIQIGGETYELLLTTKATKEIAKRYGGLENLGTKLMKSENFEMALDEIIWLIALMANQSVLIYNLRHKDDPKPLLTEEEVELLTSPLELATYKDAIMEAMFRGTKRNIESEADPKNVPVG